MHFECLPTELDDDQIADYLYLVQQQHNTPSESYFKHSVYGLRFLFRLEGLNDKRIALPSIKKDLKLPIVLSREEVKRLLITPKLLKHRLLLAILYGCGLRCMEVRSIKISHIDYDRKTLLVPKTKGNKDRYVPLSDLLIRGIKKYIESEVPTDYLFGMPRENRAGGEFDSRYSQRGVQWAVKEAVKAAGIKKEVCVHTLRHTYATHLLEEGLNILTIKNLLGHSAIESTMIYLHVANSARVSPFSPLDTLYKNEKRS